MPRQKSSFDWKQHVTANNEADIGKSQFKGGCIYCPLTFICNSTRVIDHYGGGPGVSVPDEVRIAAEGVIAQRAAAKAKRSQDEQLQRRLDEGASPSGLASSAWLTP